MRIRPRLLCWLVTSVLLLSHWTANAQTTRSEPSLFLKSAPAPATAFAPDPNAKRQREAMIDREVLSALLVQPAPARFTLNLFTLVGQFLRFPLIFHYVELITCLRCIVQTEHLNRS